MAIEETIKVCKPTNDNRNTICPYDHYSLIRIDTVRAKYGNTIMLIPTYRCPVCNRDYTSIRNINDLAVIKLQGDRFINLNLPQGKKRIKLEDPEQGASTKTKTKKRNENTFPRTMHLAMFHLVIYVLRQFVLTRLVDIVT